MDGAEPKDTAILINRAKGQGVTDGRAGDTQGGSRSKTQGLYEAVAIVKTPHHSRQK